MKYTILLLTALLAACASTDDALMRESAMSIGTRADSVQLREVERGATTVTWEAVTSKGVYYCTADDMLRRVNCSQ